MEAYKKEVKRVAQLAEIVRKAKDLLVLLEVDKKWPGNPKTRLGLIADCQELLKWEQENHSDLLD